MTNLIALPNEILHNIFRHVDPVDLAHLSTSCRFLNDNIASDGQLYRAVYCQILVSERLLSLCEKVREGWGGVERWFVDGWMDS